MVHCDGLVAANWLETLLEVVCEAPRGEVEPSSNKGKHAEANELEYDTRHSKVPAQIRSLLGILICRLRAGQYDCTAQL